MQCLREDLMQKPVAEKYCCDSGLVGNVRSAVSGSAHSLREAPSRLPDMRSGPGGGSAMHGSPWTAQSKSWETWAKWEEGCGFDMWI